MTSVSETYLLRRIDLVRSRVTSAVAMRRVSDPEPDDPWRGLYVTPDQATRLLDPRPALSTAFDDLDQDRLALEAWGDDQESEGERIRLREVAHSFCLSPLDVEILLVAVGPDLDPRLERAYGYLHDDVTRRRASVGLALELCRCDPFDAVARHHVSPGGRLVSSRLLVVEDDDRPFLTRSLRMPDPVTAYLLGDDSLDPVVAALVTPAIARDDFDPSPIVRAVRAGIRLLYIRDRAGAAALSYTATAAAASGLSVLPVDLNRLGAGDDVEAIAVAACRQARLSGSALIAGPVEVLAERGPMAVRAFAETEVLVMLIGDRTWDPLWSRTPPVQIEAPEITEPFGDALTFRLTPEQAEQARKAARQDAIAHGVEESMEHLAAGARAQNSGGLERLALRISPVAGFEDLVLPGSVLQQLRELIARLRYRDQIVSGWGLKRGTAKGRGASALFAGDSGTGKTLAAEVVAGALGLDLYVIDLATVVDKYIGETEKNLDRIFREADRVNGVLLFDEADAIFGKRSDVQDAHDRYANIEVAYLLQRMERFDGIAVLTTNLRANIDDAFLRRLDVLIDFPLPDEEMRRQLWERHLPPSLPQDLSVDLDFLAQTFELAGGNIRNITLAAAFYSATASRPLTMTDLIWATGREYRKLGRLCLEAEFGPYHSLLALPGGVRADV